MTVHKHHVVPVHKGGKDGPIVEMNPWDHAELHAKRFLDGRDDWFHPGLLFLLEPELEKLVRQKYSEVQKQKYEDGTHPFCDPEPWTDERRQRQSEKYTGSGNPMFGVEPTVKGWSWWTDGITDVMSPHSPGKQWTRGRTNVSRGHDSVLGQQWFNNGTTEVLSFSCPEGFEPGRLPLSLETKEKMRVGQIGLLWWNNGEVEIQSRNQPDGFVRGRIPNKGNKKPVKLLDTLTGETTYFESNKLCCEFLGITKKVFMNRRDKQTLVNNRFLILKG